MLTVCSWLQAIFYMVKKCDAAEKAPEVNRGLFNLYGFAVSSCKISGRQMGKELEYEL